MTHICISKLNIIGSYNGLSPGWRQAIIWTYAGILLIGMLGTNFGKILSEIHTFSFKKMHLKMSYGNWWQFCLSLNVLHGGMFCTYCEKMNTSWQVWMGENLFPWRPLKVGIISTTSADAIRPPLEVGSLSITSADSIQQQKQLRCPDCLSTWWRVWPHLPPLNSPTGSRAQELSITYNKECGLTYLVWTPIMEVLGLILGLCPANERRRYKVTPSLIGWAQT